MSANRFQKLELLAEHPVLLGVEGLDYAYTLLHLYLEQPKYDRLYVYDYTTVGRPRTFLSQAAKLRNFDEVCEGVAIIRDAENDASGAGDQLRAAFRSQFGVDLTPGTVDQSTGKTFGFLVVPATGEGALESALLGAAAPETLECVEDFVRCRDQQGATQAWHDKARVHTAIAGSKSPAMTLGHSVKAGLWDPNAESLKPIREFLNALSASGS